MAWLALTATRRRCTPSEDASPYTAETWWCRQTKPLQRYKRPLQVSRYLRQFPSPRSPNWSLLRQACLNSPHTSLRTGLWQLSRYLRQFPSPCSPSASLFSQARRNCSHCPSPRPLYTRTPPGPTSMDWEKAEIGITKRAVAAAAPNTYLRSVKREAAAASLLSMGADGAGVIASRHRPP